MTQEQALEEFKAMFPDRADKLKVERERAIGYDHGHMNTFSLWDYSGIKSELTQSTRSWEHLISLVKVGNEGWWPVNDSPIDAA